MGIFERDPVGWASSRLKVFTPGLFNVSYDPEFPRVDGTTFRWFQVVFVVGPANDAAARDQVHALFGRMLPVLSRLRAARKADAVSLRARRRMLGESPFGPDNPVMFIEAYWPGAALEWMRRRGDFSAWADECVGYINRFNASDPFNGESR